MDWGFGVGGVVVRDCLDLILDGVDLEWLGLEYCLCLDCFWFFMKLD